MIYGPWVKPRHESGPRDQVIALAKRGTELTDIVTMSSCSDLEFPSTSYNHISGSSHGLLFPGGLFPLKGLEYEASVVFITFTVIIFCLN